MTDFLKRNSDFKQWQQAAAHLNTLILDSLRPASEAGTTDDTAFKSALANAFTYNAQWPAERLIYTYGQMDTDGLISQALVNNVTWQAVFNAKACFGPLEDLQKVYECGQAKDIKLSLDEALGWSSRTIGLCQGMKSSGCYETTEQLFKWGANPSASNTNFYNAVSECGAAFGKLYARYGLSGDALAAYTKQALSKGQVTLHRQFREIYWEYGRFTVADPETLVEKKLLDTAETSQLKVVFNFASGRVSEIYEWKEAGRQPVVRDFTLDEYGLAAVQAAREKLVELGGNPSSEKALLQGKKSFPLSSPPTKAKPH